MCRAIFLEQKTGALAIFILEQKTGALAVFILEQKTEAGCCVFFGAKRRGAGRFFWSRKFAAAVLFAAEILFSQFFRQSERLICAVVVKGNFLRTVFG